MAELLLLLPSSSLFCLLFDIKLYQHLFLLFTSFYPLPSLSSLHLTPLHSTIIILYPQNGFLLVDIPTTLSPALLFSLYHLFTVCLELALCRTFFILIFLLSIIFANSLPLPVMLPTSTIPTLKL